MAFCFRATHRHPWGFVTGSGQRGLYSPPVLAVNPLLSTVDPLSRCFRLHHENGTEFVAGRVEAQNVGPGYDFCLVRDLQNLNGISRLCRIVPANMRADAHGIARDKGLFYGGIWRLVPRRYRCRADVADAPLRLLPIQEQIQQPLLKPVSTSVLVERT